MFRYRVNEFEIESNFTLVADGAIDAPGAGVPLCVRRESLADVPSLLRKLRRQLTYDVGTGLLLEPRSTLALLIDYHADKITVDCADESVFAASAWLWNAALGCRTLLRGGLPLHAAGVEVAGRYIGIMAASGSGKSTLTHYLLTQTGATFGNDDLIPVYAENGSVTAYPSVSLYPKIGADIAERDGLPVDSLIRSDSDPNRVEYYVPLPVAKRMTEPASLSALFVLEPDDSAGESVTCERLADPADRLASDMHAHWFVGRFLNAAKIAARVEAVAETVPVYRLTYRRDFAVLPRLADAIESAVQ